MGSTLTPHAKNKASRIIWAIGCGLLLMALFYLISINSLSFALHRSRPNDALRLNSRNVSALISLTSEQAGIAARDKLENGALPTSSGARPQPAPSSSANDELTMMTQQLRVALQSDPLNAQGLRLLGQISFLEGKADKAKLLMAKASDLSTHELLAHDIMLRINAAEKRYQSALFYGNRLFSGAPNLIGGDADILIPFLHDRATRNALVDMLARRPVWRPYFFNLFIPKIASADLEAARSLYDALNIKDQQTSAPELNSLLYTQIKNNRLDVAYATWLMYLPAEKTDMIGFINNGGFDYEPSAAPFDWNISGGKEAKAKIAPFPFGKGNLALNIEFGLGRVSFPTIYQYIILTPGHYRFHGAYRGDIAAKRGLQWTITCLNGNRSGESDMILGRASDWKPFSFDFTIPEKDCDAQRLALYHAARSPSEQLISGSIWFDNLLIERATAEETKPHE